MWYGKNAGFPAFPLKIDSCQDHFRFKVSSSDYGLLLIDLESAVRLDEGAEASAMALVLARA